MRAIETGHKAGRHWCAFLAIVAAVATLCPAGAAEQPAYAEPRDFCSAAVRGRVLHATPASYRDLLVSLRPGDMLDLAPGHYDRLTLTNLRGAPGRCIIIAGPKRGRRTIIDGSFGRNTVEIADSSYLAIHDLVIDSHGYLGADGIKAGQSAGEPTHHIVLEGNTILGAGATQQTDGLSTKTPTWDWIIRGNTIIGAGTGIYLGNSDGSDPFIAGLIEGNLVIDPIGYAMEIKFQISRPRSPGMPEGPQTTVIRNNVFIKNGRASPDGDRPNLLVGGFPDAGPGAQDLYQIYGNFLARNPREALFQGSGRISFHDNILVDGGAAAAVFRDHDLPLKLAHVYNNTVFTARLGIVFGSRARESEVVLGNLVFAETPLLGAASPPESNILARPATARRFVNAPSARLGEMDFFPRGAAVRGRPLDLSPFAGELDFDRDFNGTSKGDRCFRGAYAGAGSNPGWRLAATLKGR
ncbi:MAG TPA: hypothetical protein VFA50_04050 [Stellaceae bacterium]|nr:hypothetical protein [Stellaceae bacterium]